MDEIFIKEIQVNAVRNIEKFRIPLSADKKYDLIITGKNGSGKTTLLMELKTYIGNIANGNLNNYDQQVLHLENFKRQLIGTPSDSNPNNTLLKKNLERNIQNIQNWLNLFGGTKIVFNETLQLWDYIASGDFIFAFFPAKRHNVFKTPTGINKINLRQVYNIDEAAGKDFIQYIVNLTADRSFAKDDNDSETVIKIDKWFADFEENLFRLFDTKNIKLSFDRKNYNFTIIEDSKEPYNLNQLSDGYSAILSIVTELIMRMEVHKVKNYDVQGVVIVDEIETHLHIELQKRILPFLTSFFPKIQFIVTTHSPFVLSSISNAVICDLEKKTVTTDLTGYSYNTLIESYFESDNYSIELNNKINEYETLKGKRNLTQEEENQLLTLESYLKEIPKFISNELTVKLQQIKLKDIKKKQ